MSVHVVIEVEVRDAPLYEDYRHKLPPTMAEYGGKPIVRGFAKLMEGNTSMDRISVIEFPDAAAALAWYASPQVQVLGAQRRAAATVTVRLVGA